MLYVPLNLDSTQQHWHVFKGALILTMIKLNHTRVWLSPIPTFPLVCTHTVLSMKWSQAYIICQCSPSDPCFCAQCFMERNSLYSQWSEPCRTTSEPFLGPPLPSSPEPIPRHILEHSHYTNEPNQVGDCIQAWLKICKIQVLVHPKRRSGIQNVS